MSWCLCCFFFFQAEDGIRDGHVTGVQTCALPIFVRHHLPLIRGNLVLLFSRQDEQAVNTQIGREQLRQLALQEINELRSEERRVGKEWRARWWTGEQRENKSGVCEHTRISEGAER